MNRPTPRSYRPWFYSMNRRKTWTDHNPAWMVTLTSAVWVVVIYECLAAFFNIR